jgi:hypothetical protein
MSTDGTDPAHVLARERAEILRALAQSPEHYTAAKDFARRMRAKRAFDELGIVCDAMRYYDPNDLIIRVWEAQSLVDRGMPMAARDVLLPAVKLAVEKNDETAWLEIQGLLGRSAKQIFVENAATAPWQATAYLEEALTAYRTAFSRNPSKAWYQGGNVAALLRRKSMLFGGPATVADDSAAFAEDLRKTCDAIPVERRDYWWYATSAEVELGRGNYEAFAGEVKKFLDHRDDKGNSDTDSFALNSMLRQLREVWLLDTDNTPAVARGTLALLSTALLQSGDSKEALVVPADSVADQRTIDDVTRGQLQKVFGDVGPMSVDWWELGLKRARSVAAIYGPGPMGMRRVGTGFLIKIKVCNGGDVGCFVLTNAHVIGDPDSSLVAVQSYQEAAVRFEGYDPARNFKVKSVAWVSGAAELDATLLEIEGCPPDIEPIPVMMTLPDAASKRRLYIIGHAGGNELAFSFEDNQLLDHEGPLAGHPRQQGVIRIHYRTPTVGGSSGSPVFVDNRWTAIGLHHSGSAMMQKLNDKPGTYQANEGIALSSISKALGSKNWELCT